jgi:hypothetical protein
MLNLITHAKDRIARHIAGPHGSTILLRWVEAAGVTTVDVTTGAVLSETPPTVRVEKVRGMIHYIAPVISQVRQFEEVAAGDAMIDLPPEVVIEGRDQLEFLIDGKVWVQKKLSEKLRDYWDVYIGGERLYRTVLVGVKG